MTDRQLKYLITLAEEGNMTTAAQKLFISQPSLSYLLGHVEKELGAELFNRNTVPLSLTEAGESYIEAARKILGIKREMENCISDLTKQHQSTLQIGCGAQLSAILYPMILPEFMRDHPDVRLKLVEDHFADLCIQFSRGELDLVVANRPLDSNAAESTLLYREEIGLVAPAAAPLKASEDGVHKYPVVDIEELEKIPFILVKKSQNLRKTIDEMFDTYGIRPQILLETNNSETCYRMVGQNIGYTIIPYTPLFMSLDTDKVLRYSFPGDHFREVRIFWSKRGYKSESLRHFVKLCQERLTGTSGS